MQDASVHEPGSLAQPIFCTALFMFYHLKTRRLIFCKGALCHSWSVDTRKNLNRFISTERTEGDTAQQLAPLSLDFP